MKLVSLLYFVFLIYFSKQDSLPKNVKVLGAFELVRHGARTPLIKESHSELYFGTQRSQLTINGFRQHVLLGRWLRRRYVLGDIYPLLNKNFYKQDLNEIYFKTANFQRAVFSSSAHLLGLFPKAIIKLKYEGHEEIKNNDIPPIKNFHDDLRDGREMVINVANKDKDTLFKIHNCKLNSTLTLKDEAAKFHSSHVFTLTDNQIKEAIDDILTHFHHVVLKSKKKSVDTEVEGKEDKQIEKAVKKNLRTREYVDDTQNKRTIPKYSLKTLSKFISALRPYKYHNKLKVNLKESTLLTMKKQVLNKLYQVRLSESPQKKLFSSHLLMKLITFFNEIREKKTKTKLMVLTAFDTNIVDLISNLFDTNFLRKSIPEALHDQNLYRFLAPPLASSVIFELVQIENDSNYYIRIIYNGKEINSNLAKPVRHSPTYDYLDYNDLSNLIQSRIDSNYEKVNCDS